MSLARREQCEIDVSSQRGEGEFGVFFFPLPSRERIYRERSRTVKVSGKFKNLPPEEKEF